MMSNRESLVAKLQAYRKRLFNFSRRNKELYFKPSKLGSINLTQNPFKKSKVKNEVLEKIDEEIFQQIANDFEPLNIGALSTETLFKSGQISLTEHLLLKRLPSNLLEKTLDKIRLEDRKYQREFGISGAWLLGPFICIRPSASAKKADLLIAPIFKIPIDIDKNKSKSFKLVIEDSTFAINPSLRLFLRENRGVNLPEYVDESTMLEATNEFIRLIEASGIKTRITTATDIPAIPKRSKRIQNEFGEVVETKDLTLQEALPPADLEIYETLEYQQAAIVDCLYLDKVNASKAALIGDYDHIIEAAGSHPIVSQLLSGTPVPEKREDGTDLDVLNHYKERSNCFVVDSNASQHRAMDRAKRSKAIVIQGPPGTGKSQTITNLVADLIRDGKRVLFVSEKRAALDVVYSRLQQAKIDNLAVLIHSSDLNKKELYETFMESLLEKSSATTQQAWIENSDKVDDLKTKIEKPLQCLKKEHRSGLSLSDLMVNYSSSSKPDPVVGKAFSDLKISEIRGVQGSLLELESLCSRIPNINQHPWINKRPKTFRSNELVRSLEEIHSKIESADQIYLNYLTKYSLNISSNADFYRLKPNPETQKPNYPDNLFKRDPSQGDLENLIATIQNMSDSINSWTKFKSDSDFKLIQECYEYFKYPRGFFSGFTPAYWKHRSLGKSLSKFRSLHTSDDFKNAIDIENLMNRQDIVSWEVFKNHWTDAESEEKFRHLVEILNYVVEISELSDTHELAINKLVEARNNFPEVEKAIEIERDSTKSLAHHIVLTEAVPLKPLLKRLMETINDLDTIDKILIKIGEVETTHKIECFKSFVLDKLAEKADWGKIILDSVTEIWTDEAKLAYPELRSFDPKLHSENIIEYEKQLRVQQITCQNHVRENSVDRTKIESKGLQILEKEANKKKRIKSPREVMELGAMATMVTLKPCWLMSPLSISQILPNTPELFDAVVFDEASQVKVEDALPSIYRGAQLIVVGDDKQMPPTNFFSMSADEDDDEEEEIAESILDLATMVYPSEMLEWHYRSRSESLIAFSNRAFYGGRLIAVPNPHSIGQDDSIEFILVSNGTFSQKDGNAVEARKIVDYLAQKIINNPEQSIGVIAMGHSQQRAIEREIDDLRSTNKDFANALESNENLMVEGTFAGLIVKNLENIQGDERDHIIISVGYAAPSLGKKLRQAFGPLSSQGGERRLNVAITRAKRQATVFCSFEPSEIPTDASHFEKNPSKVYFGRYLKYVHAVSDKKHEIAQEILDSFGMSGVRTQRKPTKFNLDVKREIENLGYKVATEVGTCGFFIDLAVEHPVNANNFILGIECDGAIFHSDPYSRDRDVARQKLLESRGWKIHRVWSTDWSQNRQREIEKLKIAINSLIEPVAVNY